MKKTYSELSEIDQEVAKLYDQNKDLRESKFGYGYKRFYSKNIDPIIKKMRGEIEDLNVEHALEDDKTSVLLIVDGQYQYSREGKMKLMKAQRELIDRYEKTEFEIDPYFITNVPVLDEYQKELFLGCLIEDNKISEKPAKKKKD